MKNRAGFSLVLTLIIVALLTLTVLLSAAFINIESRLAMQHHLATRARMNAVTSLRLAMAHLQQEAGPDRRMTARADITADKLQPGWTWEKIRNPLWTGVWRSDKPLQPPAWLVSGGKGNPAGSQSVSLAGERIYNANTYKPEDVDYGLLNKTSKTPDPTVVTLVGDTSASDFELPTTKTVGGATVPDKLGKPDGRIALPRINLPDNGTNGSYAYWVGDEGVKARINLRDPRLTNTGKDANQTRQEALRGAARSGVEILKGFDATSMPATGLDARINSFQTLALQPSGMSETTPPTVAKRLFTETTFWSRGVNCDSQFGGLKIDLSNAFELSDTAWVNSEFVLGSQPTGMNGVTYLLNGNKYTSSTGTVAFGDTIAQKNSKVAIPYELPDKSISEIAVSTVYSTALKFTGSGELARGPTWDALRNYYRLYRQVEWTNDTQPELIARAHFPNNVALGSANGKPAHYGDRYNFSAAPPGQPAQNFLILDTLTTVGLGNKPAPRPTKVAVTPYVARQLMVWGLIKIPSASKPGAYTVALTLTPIIVLHNPYNVSLSIKGMRISFNEWKDWSVRLSKTSSTEPLEIQERSLSELYGVGNLPDEVMHLDIPPNTLLKPGDFKVFSANNGRPQLITNSNAVACANNYDQRGGFYIPLTDTKRSEVTLANDEGLNIYVDISNPSVTYNGDPKDPAKDPRYPTKWRAKNKVFGARVKLECWPNDNLSNVSSEINQLRSDGLHLCGRIDGKSNFPPKDKPANPVTLSYLTSSGQPPFPLAVFDYGIRWPRSSTKAVPLFSHSNPMAAVTRADAAASTLSTSYAGTSISYKMTASDLTSLTTGVIETETNSEGEFAYGGYAVSPGDGGQKNAVYTEVPLSPPLSLAQLSHANFTIRDQEPLFAIGNSFRPLFQQTNDMGYLDTKQIPTIASTWDHSWMLNSALFDRFYFSGAAPKIERISTDPNKVIKDKVKVTKQLTEVLDDFVAGTGTLSNPRTVLFSNRDPKTVREWVGDHRRIAGATLSEGTFNVNSTSVEAWSAVLASAKRNAMGNADEDKPSNNANSRYPRGVRADRARYNYKTPFANNDDNDAYNAWTGLTTLDDDQIRLLAKSIVDEIRFRVTLLHRGPLTSNAHPELTKASGLGCSPTKSACLMDIPVPFFGLAQFVNRNLCGYPTANSTNCVAGCLQSAIIRTDVDSGGISNRASNQAPGSGITQGISTYLSPDSSTPGRTPYVFNTGYLFLPNTKLDPWANQSATDANSRSHLLLGAPTSLTQADILSAIGSSLATRSDTFVIRCYGDAANDAGGIGAGCWIEAVVQRTPEFIDASQTPETEVCDPTDSFKNNPKLLAVNRCLGRRFQVVSIRYLSPQEL